MNEIKIKILKDEIQPMMKKLLERLGDLSPLMKNIGEMALASIRKTFEAGGKPSAWPSLKPSTIKQRQRLDMWPGKILIRDRTGGLLWTIGYRPESRRVLLTANKPYAAIQHFGGQAGKGHKATIPARPYMLIQAEDWAEIKRMAEAYLTKSGG